MTWAEKNAEALDNAAAQILQHGIPRVIRTAGNISECACGGCQLARALISAKAEIERLTRVLSDAEDRAVAVVLNERLYPSDLTPSGIISRDRIMADKIRAALQPAPEGEEPR